MLKKIYIILSMTIFIFQAETRGAFDSPDGEFFSESNAAQNSRLPISDKSLAMLANSARVVAQRLLARNAADKKGLIILKFANHIAPENRDILLLRGKLKFKVKIDPPKDETTPEDFLKQIKRAASFTYHTNDALGRHFLTVLCQMIRLFEPSNEGAIITLMNFEDKGFNTDLNELLEQKLTATLDVQYDPKDPRYVVSNVKKTIFVPAKQPWTDTWIKVKEGKIIRVRSKQQWSMGFTGNRASFPSCSGDGYQSLQIDQLIPSTKTTKKKTTTTKKFQKSSLKGNPGCLLAKIGNKEYAVGSEAIFRAESSGILFLGPYEWSDYSDNLGSLKVTVQVSDK